MIDVVVVGEAIVLLLVIIELSHACIPPPSPSNTQCFHTINTVAIADGLLRELSWRKSKSAAWIYLRAIVLVLSFSQCNESFKEQRVFIRNNQLNGWQYTMNSTYINKNCKQSYIISWNFKTIARLFMIKNLNAVVIFFMMNEKWTTKHKKYFYERSNKIDINGS